MNTIDLFCVDDDIDVFILAARGDGRSFAAYDNLVNRGARCNRVVVLDYGKQEENYVKYFQNQKDVVFIRCDSQGDFCDKILDLDIKKVDSIAFDITCVSTPDVFRLFYLLKEIIQVQWVHVFYSEPKFYKSINDFYSNHEREITEIEYRPLTEYFTSAFSRNVLLVCFLGFERLISKYIHERNEHSEVLVVNGFPAYYPKIKDISLERNYELISAIGSDRIRYSQANNPYSVYNTLLSISKEYDDWVLDICVLGSKPMALGACMFALNHSRVAKVSYPFPKDSSFTSVINRSIDYFKIWWYRIRL